MLPTISDLFDLTHTKHAKLLEGIMYPWDALPNIAEYITSLLAQPEDNTKKQYIGSGTKIATTAIIEDNVIIGDNCEIRPGAYIRENSIIGDNVIVGNSTEIKNALLFDNVNVPHFNYVGDSILGYKAHLGAGVIISNYKSDGSKIKVTDGEAHYDTGLIKFGALLGDHVEIGSNSVLNPGTIIGAGTSIYPGAMIRGVIPGNSIVKVRQQQEIVELKHLPRLA